MAIKQVSSITKSIYGRCPKRLFELYNDVKDLYEGRWPEYEACQVGYHTFHHVEEVALATSYMVAGWHKSGKEPIPLELFLCGMAACLFHDAGYLKDKGDQIGKGGKYSFTHEVRSAKIALRYLNSKNWPERSKIIVPEMILLTDIKIPPRPSKKLSYIENVIASMVASADLLAQMADPNYLDHLSHLLEELQEAYAIEGIDKLSRRGINCFHLCPK